LITVGFIAYAGKPTFFKHTPVVGDSSVGLSPTAGG
jgi:hypothetical protein